jgi:hypothetical protein
MCSQGLPEEFAISPIGLKIASLLRRDALGQTGQAASNAPNPAAASVAAALLAQSPGQNPVNGPSARDRTPGQPLTREQQIKSEILNARPKDPVLGFQRRSQTV